MTNWIVIPVKSPDLCKSRLRGALADADRRALVAAMLLHVVGAASEVGDAKVLLLGPSRHGLSASMPLLADEGDDLNGAAASAVRIAIEAGVDRIAFVAADLPLVTHTELEMLLARDDEVSRDDVAIAADRLGQGTNALALPLPRAGGFRFGYGPGSFRRHRADAARLGLRVQEIRAPGLGFDIDTPADLAALAAA